MKVREVGQVGEGVFGEHGREAALADAVAGGERVDVADDLVGFADVLAQERDERVVDAAPVEEAHDGDLDAFLVERVAVGAEAAAADVDDMGGAGEEAHVAALMEGGGDDGDVVEVAGAHPGVVGDVDVAFGHRFGADDADEMGDGVGHGVDVSGRAGDGLGEHLAFRVVDAGGEVAGLAHGGREGGADEGLGLLLDHGDEAVPHDLAGDGGHRRLLVAGGPCGRGSC